MRLCRKMHSVEKKMPNVSQGTQVSKGLPKEEKSANQTSESDKSGFLYTMTRRGMGGETKYICMLSNKGQLSRSWKQREDKIINGSRLLAFIYSSEKSTTSETLIIKGELYPQRIHFSKKSAKKGIFFIMNHFSFGIFPIFKVSTKLPSDVRDFCLEVSGRAEAGKEVGSKYRVLR